MGKENTSGPKSQLLKLTKISKSEEPQLGEGGLGIFPGCG